MKTNDFDLKVPSELIAQVPVEPRDSSRLLLIDKSTGLVDEGGNFSNLSNYFKGGDILVFNNSRVIPARLKGHKESSPMEEITLLLLREKEKGLWEALIEVGTLRLTDKVVLTPPELKFTVFDLGRNVGKRNERLVLGRFSDDSLIEQAGQPPVPPYIHNYTGDPEKYQTIYSKIKGSAACPTAGLHFTNELLDTLSNKGVIFAFITLHVGIDTFMPILEEDVETHRIYTEYCEVSKATSLVICNAKLRGSKIICVGTTTVRTLETSQGMPYLGWTSKYIYPGYKFGIVDQLITNFHYPKSSNLVLVSAFAGVDLIKKAYEKAIELKYRFYSFGDACLIL